MARPLQHISQYIPTDFGQVSQLAQLYNQDIAAKNQLYNQALAMEQNYLAQLAQAQTSDIAERNRLMEDLQSRIGEVVQKRGGDYGAAAEEIGRIIATERANPWYQYDAAKLASLQQEAKLRQAWGPDYMAGRDYGAVTLDDYIADPNIFTSTSINLAPYRQAVAKRGQAEAALRTKDIDYTDPKDKFTRIVGQITGYDTPEDVASFMKGRGSEIIDDVMKDMGLEGNEQARALLENELISNIRGKKDISRFANRQAIMEAEAAKKAIKNNPYIPLRGVGEIGVENIYPITGKKDFWRVGSNDNTVEGLSRKTIIKDITADEEFLKSNKKYLDEFGNIEAAKKIVDNYSPSGSVVDTPIIQEEMAKIDAAPGSRLYQIELAKAYNKLEQQGKVDPQAGRKSLEEYNRAKKLVDNFETQLNTRLFEENSDLKKRFKHFDPFSDISDKRRARFQEFVSNELDLNALIFEGSNNKDINFAELDADDKLDDENYISAKNKGNTQVTGYAVDPLLGIKLIVKTKVKSKKGQKDDWVTHIASPANDDVERLIMDAYTGGQNTPELNSYIIFKNNQYGQALMQGMDTPVIQDTKPELIPEPGISIREYKKSLINKRDRGIISPEDAQAIIIYLNNNFRDDITL